MKRILLILLCIWLVGCSKISDLQLIYDEVADDLPLLMEVNEEIIEEVYDLEVDDIKQFVIYRPISNVEADEFILIHAHEGKVEAIKVDLDVYFAMMEEYWKDHLPLQYQKLHHRKELIIDDYYCVVVSDDADKIIDKVKELLEA